MRKPTLFNAVAEAHVEVLTVNDLPEVTGIGLPGHDHELPNYSPGGTGRWANKLRRTLRLVEETPRTDAVDGIIATTMTKRFGLELENIEASDQLVTANNIDSPIQRPRNVFNLMPAGTDED